MSASSRLRHWLWRIALSTAVMLPVGAAGGEADVVAVDVRQTSPGVFDFDVTVRSHDTGWDFYADAIEIVAPDGDVLGTRILLHPHETEQPFTRDVYGVKIPPDTTRVTVRAHHRPKGYDGETIEIVLPR